MKKKIENIIDSLLNKSITKKDAIAEIYLLANQPKIKLKEKQKKADKFIEPSLENVIDYFVSNNYKVEVAERCFNYYNEGKWIDRNGKKVVNWKQKVISTWFRDNNRMTKHDKVDYIKKVLKEYLISEKLDKYIELVDRIDFIESICLDLSKEQLISKLRIHIHNLELDNIITNDEELNKFNLLSESERNFKLKDKKDFLKHDTRESEVCLFNNSRFTKYEDFILFFNNEINESIDMRYYFDIIKSWSESKEAKRFDWIETTKLWIQRNKDENKLKLINNNNENLSIAVKPISKSDLAYNAYRLGALIES